MLSLSYFFRNMIKIPANVVKTVLGVVVVIVFGCGLVLGSVVYFRSNWSSEQRMATSLSVWNENIETALAAVNTRQATVMGAAYTVGIDARALGASIMARRLIGVRPLVQEWREITGLAAEIGFAQVSVQSTEAVLRVVFSPTMEDSLLYYPRVPTAPFSEHRFSDVYASSRKLLQPHYSASPEQIREALRRNEELNIHIAALALKQAQTRLAQEREYEKTGLHTKYASDYSLQHAAPTTVFAALESDEVRRVAALLYRRDDVLP